MMSALAFLVVSAGLVAAGGQELAVVRPFASKEEIRHLGSSFATWNENLPCGDRTRTSIDLFLVYSQGFREHADVSSAVDKVVEDFKHRREPWHRCFRDLHVLTANLTAVEDIYNTSHQENKNWVSGPNAVFRYILHKFLGSKYAVFFIMEMDAVPNKAAWLEQLEREVLDFPPAAIRGSSYKSDNWNSYRGELPKALRLHINGNAIYNTSSPFLLWMSARLDEEKDSERNMVPYDLRISELVIAGREKTDIASAQAWSRSVAAGEDLYADDSRLIGNYAATLTNKSFGGAGEFILHRSRGSIYDEMNPAKLTLGVRYVSDDGIKAMEESLANSHSFSKVLVLTEDGVHGKETYPTKTKNGNITLQWELAKGSSGDMCELARHVKTEFFAFLVGNSRIHQAATVLVDGSKPLVPFEKVDSGSCRSVCNSSVTMAKKLFGVEINRHIKMGDTIFRTRTALKFCAVWENLNQTRPPSADDYMGWLRAGKMLETEYHQVDRAEKGWHKLSKLDRQLPAAPPVQTPERRLQENDTSNCHGTNCTNVTCEDFADEAACEGAGSPCHWDANNTRCTTNLTDCDSFDTQAACEGAPANRCEWDASFGECRRSMEEGGFCPHVATPEDFVCRDKDLVKVPAPEGTWQVRGQPPCIFTSTAENPVLQINTTLCPPERRWRFRGSEVEDSYVMVPVVVARHRVFRLPYLAEFLFSCFSPAKKDLEKDVPVLLPAPSPSIRTCGIFAAEVQLCSDSVCSQYVDLVSPGRRHLDFEVISTSAEDRLEVASLTVCPNPNASDPACELLVRENCVMEDFTFLGLTFRRGTGAEAHRFFWNMTSFAFTDSAQTYYFANVKRCNTNDQTLLDQCGHCLTGGGDYEGRLLRPAAAAPIVSRQMWNGQFHRTGTDLPAGGEVSKASRTEVTLDARVTEFSRQTDSLAEVAQMPAPGGPSPGAAAESKEGHGSSHGSSTFKTLGLAAVICGLLLCSFVGAWRRGPGGLVQAVVQILSRLSVKNHVPATPAPASPKEADSEPTQEGFKAPDPVEIEAQMPESGPQTPSLPPQPTKPTAQASEPREDA